MAISVPNTIPPALVVVLVPICSSAPESVPVPRRKRPLDVNVALSALAVPKFSVPADCPFQRYPLLPSHESNIPAVAPFPVVEFVSLISDCAEEVALMFSTNAPAV